MDGEKKLYVVKGSMAFLMAVIGDKLEMISPIMLLLILLMIADYISGMLAAKKEAVEHPGDNNYGWSSKKSIIGIYKKVGYILTILVAISTDYVIYNVAEKMKINFDANTFFGFLVTVWLVINELISILENAGRMGAALPKLLQNVLAELKKNIDDYSDQK